MQTEDFQDLPNPHRYGTSQYQGRHSQFLLKRESFRLKSKSIDQFELRRYKYYRSSIDGMLKCQIIRWVINMLKIILLKYLINH